MWTRLRTLIESYIFVLVAALTIGLLVPQTKTLVTWNILFLQVIFFLSSLKLDLADFFRRFKDWRLILLTSAFMLVVLPLVIRAVFAVTPSSFAPVALALFLLAAMPSGMTAPLLVELVGGKQALALVITISTSLLAPFTIPLVTSFAYSSSIHVDAFAMLRTLSLVIFVPFALAILVKRMLPHQTTRVLPFTKPISILLMGLTVASAIAPHADRILTSLRESPGGLFVLLVVVFAFFAVLHILGYKIAWWKSVTDRQTLAVCLTYMNFTLAIFLASRFFPDKTVVLTLVLSIIPWATMLPLWKRFSKHYT